MPDPAQRDARWPLTPAVPTIADLPVLRRAVGDRELTYPGFSYGIYIGATYATLFPKRARALVLDGADPPGHARAPLESLFVQSEGVELSLNRFFGWCETSPICGFEGGRAAFDRLYAATATTPLRAIASGDPRPVLRIDVRSARCSPSTSVRPGRCSPTR